MPSPTRRPRRAKAIDVLAELDWYHVQDLKSGSSNGGRPGFATREQMEETWDAVRDELLPEFIATRPGRRPFAWWLFDHGQERPILDSATWQGAIPRIRAAARFGFLHTSNWSNGKPLQQTETHYLDEHGLLTAEELAVLPFEEPYPEFGTTADFGRWLVRNARDGVRRRPEQEGK